MLLFSYIFGKKEKEGNFAFSRKTRKEIDVSKKGFPLILDLAVVREKLKCAWFFCDF